MLEKPVKTLERQIKILTDKALIERRGSRKKPVDILRLIENRAKIVPFLVGGGDETNYYLL